MVNWRDNFYLANRAADLADVMLTMLNNSTGEPANVPGVNEKSNGEQVVKDRLITDSEYFMSMDPARLEDEFNQQIHAANLCADADARADLELAQAALNPTVWHGTAANEFHKQMSYMKSFMDQQSAQATFAAQAAGMMYAVSVQFRESFYTLVDATIAVCNAKIKSTPVSTDLSWKSIAVDVITEVKGLVTGKTIADLASWSIDQIVGKAAQFTKETPADGEPEQIVDGYLIAYDGLVKAYDNNVTMIKDWIGARAGDLAGLNMPLLEPLPTSTDVDSPDFRYENFSYVTPVPGVDGASVEEERKRYVEEKPKPGGLIGPRLGGEEETG